MVTAATALIQGSSIEDAADAADIGRTTLWKWRNEDGADCHEFRQILRDMRERWEREVVDESVALALGRLRSLSGEAVGALEALLTPSTAPAVRRQAADTILKRIQEFIPAERLELAGSLEADIAKLDAEDASPGD